MTKKELEIRLSIAENLIKEASYLLTNQGMKETEEKARVKWSISSDTDAHVITCGVLISELGFYEERVQSAMNLDGRDIHKFELPISEVVVEELPFQDTEFKELEEQEDVKELDFITDEEILNKLNEANDVSFDATETNDDLLPIDDLLNEVYAEGNYIECETHDDLPIGYEFLGRLSVIGEGDIFFYQYRNTYYIMRY